MDKDSINESFKDAVYLAWNTFKSAESSRELTPEEIKVRDICRKAIDKKVNYIHKET